MNGDRECFLCGRNGAVDPLDRHHCFGGSLRSKSEQYGLVVYLCHHDCHIFGNESVHRNAKNRRLVQQWAQEKAMRENEWTIDEFIHEFGKNYLEDNE